VCSEFYFYFINQENHKYKTKRDVHWSKTIPDDNLNIIFEFIEFNIKEKETSLEKNSGLLSNALCTCFLKNISQTNAGEYAKIFMGPKSRAYFDQWHVYEKRL
jgi:hypothetical protein